ncbi:MAG: hypothetical protein KDD89_12815, partial [Anaerolineales bacterium]|nr:hypothetical protein [Anaerolineales bacterium]
MNRHRISLVFALFLAINLLGCTTAEEARAVAVASANESADNDVMATTRPANALPTQAVTAAVPTFTPIPTASPTAVVPTP